MSINENGVKRLAKLRGSSDDPEPGHGEDLTDKFGMGEYLTEIILLQKSESVGKRLKESPLVKDLDIDVLEVFTGGAGGCCCRPKRLSCRNMMFFVCV